MTKGTKWLYIVVGGIGALTLVFGAAFLAIQSGAASSSAETESLVLKNRTTVWFDKDDTPIEDYDEALAEALGITVEELQAAYEAAHAAAIEQAVEEGLLTQEQADDMLEGKRFGLRGQRGFHALGRGMNSFLADALGISVAELEAAQEQAHSDLLTKAVEDGKITQEEADLIQARSAIRGYVEEAMAEAYADALAQAVADGVITQAQADLLLEEGRPGTRGPGGIFFGRGSEMHGFRGRMGAFGHHHGQE
jgi:polyhydroxyalkanoate synthesis regulator phasin